MWTITSDVQVQTNLKVNWKPVCKVWNQHRVYLLVWSNTSISSSSKFEVKPSCLLTIAQNKQKEIVFEIRLHHSESHNHWYWVDNWYSICYISSSIFECVLIERVIRLWETVNFWKLRVLIRRFSPWEELYLSFLAEFKR